MATWKGVAEDQRTADMLWLVDRAYLPSTPFNPSQGAYSTSVAASGGTHSGGGAVDIQLAGLDDATAHQIETAMRRVGFAAWYRTAIPNVWPRHVHGVAINCADASQAAKDQWTAYRNGRDGLAGNGPDTGDRSYVGVTWESFLAAHPHIMEDYEMDSNQAAQLAQIAGDVAAIKSATPNIQYTSNSAMAASNVDVNEDRQRFDALAARFDKLEAAIAALTPKPAA